MCTYCKGEKLIESTTTHVVVLPECTVIIRNVPCLECVQCGEKYFTLEVSRHLDAVVAKAKKASNELLITDYDHVA